MKNGLLYFSLCLFLWGAEVEAQPSPGRYLKKVLSELENVEVSRRNYGSAVSLAANATLVEKKRREVLQTTLDAIGRLTKLGAFGKHTELRDSALSYLSLSYASLNEDYVSVSEMEAISENAFDAIESYLMARESAYKGVEAAAASLNSCIGRFAGTHGVKLRQSNKRNRDRSRAEAYKYYNLVYGIFFKCHKQEAYLLEAIAHEDLSGVEQNRRALLSSAERGLENLSRLSNRETALIQSCKTLLNFYRQEAGHELASAAEHYAGRDNFLRLKSSLDAAGAESLNTEKLEIFCRSLSEISRKNQALARNLAALKEQRDLLLKDWNRNCAAFISEYPEK